MEVKMDHMLGSMQPALKLGAQDLLTAGWAVVAVLRRSERTVPHGPSMCLAAASATALAVV